MGLLQTLSVLALRQVAHGVPMGRLAAGAATGVAGFLIDRFNDPAQRIPLALKRSTDRAWRALEIALAGESLLSRLDRAEDKAFRQQVGAFLAAIPDDAFRDPQRRKACLLEVRAIRKAGGHLAGALDGEDLAQRSAAFLRYTDPERALEAEFRYLEHLAEHLRRKGQTHLADLVARRVGDGAPLLVVAVRFFFRIEVENDPRLFQGVACARLDTLTRQVQTGFAQLEEALRQQGDRLLSKLDAIDVKLDAMDDKLETILGRLEQVLGRSSAPVARPGAPAPNRVAQDRERARTVLKEVKSLPVKQRPPDMLLDLGRLRLEVGDREGARKDFAEAANQRHDPKVQAEARELLRQLDETPAPASPPTPTSPGRWASALLGAAYVAVILVGVWCLIGPSRGGTAQTAGTALLLVGVSALVGGAGGWVLCSMRSWIYVVLCTVLGLGVGLVADALGHTLTTAGSLANLCSGVGLGVLAAYVLGVPVKGVVDIAMGNRQRV